MTRWPSLPKQYRQKETTTPKTYVPGTEKVYVLRICPCPPATNKRDRMHHHEISKLNQRVKTEVYYQVVKQGLSPLVPGVSVDATRFGPRDIDPDGLNVVVKPVLDALRYIGVLEDDTSEWIPHLNVVAGEIRASPPTLVVVVRGREA